LTGLLNFSEAVYWSNKLHTDTHTQRDFITSLKEVADCVPTNKYIDLLRRLEKLVSLLEKQQQQTLTMSASTQQTIGNSKLMNGMGLGIGMGDMMFGGSQSGSPGKDALLIGSKQGLGGTGSNAQTQGRNAQSSSSSSPFNNSSTNTLGGGPGGVGGGSGSNANSRSRLLANNSSVSLLESGNTQGQGGSNSGNMMGGVGGDSMCKGFRCPPLPRDNRCVVRDMSACVFVNI
jgi:hypothetical protein